MHGNPSWMPYAAQGVKGFDDDDEEEEQEEEEKEEEEEVCVSSPIYPACNAHAP